MCCACNSKNTEFLVIEDEMKSSALYDGAEFTAQRNNKSGSVSPFGLQNTAPGVREI